MNGSTMISHAKKTSNKNYKEKENIRLAIWHTVIEMSLHYFVSFSSWSWLKWDLKLAFSYMGVSLDSKPFFRDLFLYVSIVKTILPPHIMFTHWFPNRLKWINQSTSSHQKFLHRARTFIRVLQFRSKLTHLGSKMRVEKLVHLIPNLGMAILQRIFCTTR